MKFTPEDGTISLTVEPTADHVAVSVRDNGIGIPEDTVKSIFEPFVQAKRPVNSGDHGVGLGSTFTLTLPRCA